MEKVVNVSNQIWEAMINGDTDVLLKLVHKDAVFVHMSRSLTRDQEIEVIKEQDINYEGIDVEYNTVKEMESTIVLFNKLKLSAIVKGNVAVNPFMVTEVYTKNGDEIKLASLSFTKVIY
ncbi:MAG: nuclear transport factor 2 family protein [Coprobacillaceae bacterium]